MPVSLRAAETWLWLVRLTILLLGCLRKDDHAWLQTSAFAPLSLPAFLPLTCISAVYSLCSCFIASLPACSSSSSSRRVSTNSRCRLAGPSPSTLRCRQHQQARQPAPLPSQSWSRRRERRRSSDQKIQQCPRRPFPSASLASRKGLLRSAQRLQRRTSHLRLSCATLAASTSASSQSLSWWRFLSVTPRSTSTRASAHLAASCSLDRRDAARRCSQVR